jgi:hypothetical protein
MMSFYDTPLADLDAAIAGRPSAGCLPHVMKAGFLLSLTEPSLVAEAEAHLDAARALANHVPPRERAHLEAVQLAAGRPLGRRLPPLGRAAGRASARRAGAAVGAAVGLLPRRRAANLRARPARALPDWDEDDPLYPHVLALHAFGLEECNLHPQAEEAGRRALALEPRVPWAVHAVAHVMEMQGRFDDGAAWLRQHQPAWAEGNGFAAHLWWHKALFRLEALDTAGALRVLDGHLSGDALQMTLQRVDAAALLWRLHLLGADVTARAAAAVRRLGRWRARTPATTPSTTCMR